MLRKIINKISNAYYENDIKRFVEVEYRKADHPYAFYLLNRGLNSAEIKRRMR